MPTSRWILGCLVLLAGACAHSEHGSGDGQSSFRRLSWLEGRWTREQGIEHWVATHDALWGVSFTVKDGATAFFEVLLVEQSEEALRYVAFPGGTTEAAFPMREADGMSAVFSNPEHDFPKVIRYRRDGASLGARVEGASEAESEAFRWQAGPSGRAEPLESADRAFAADTAARGADGWVAAFDPGGAVWSRHRRARIMGEALREKMAEIFAGGTQIDWAPIASGLSPAGDIGYTVGEARYTEPGNDGRRVESGRSSYVTLWRKQADGSWKVLFDVGT